MLVLENRDLRLDLLDPHSADEQARQGWRYCWGGYVWQVHDAQHGPLLAGPEYPKPDPSAFNGQGLPESFRHSARDGRGFTLRGREGVAIGAGRVTLGENNQATLTDPCPWTVERFPDHLLFQTRQSAAGFSYALTRQVQLSGRTIVSRSTLTNVGEQPLVLQWFPHPFFALKDHRIRAEFVAGASMPENPGFALADRTLTYQRPFVSKDDSQFVLFDLPPGRPLQANLDHPVLERIEFTTSYAPDECPVWGNAHTFSIEPYLNLDLAPGQSRRWSVQYRF
jgi:hypothetical protein